MKKLSTLPVVAAICFVLFTTTSCNNNKNNSSAEENKTNEKTSDEDEKQEKNSAVSENDIVGIYTITDVKVKTGDNEQDVYDKMDYCQQHNTYGFNKDGVWYLGGVASQTCTGPDESGKWSLDGNKLTIHSEQSGIYSYTIENFDGKKLEVSSETNDNGTPSVYTTVFTKQ